MQGERGYGHRKVFQLKEECEGSAELRHIVAGLVQRVPELEFAREPREGHVTVSEETGKVTHTSYNGRTEKLSKGFRVSRLVISRGRRVRRCCTVAARRPRIFSRASLFALRFTCKSSVF
jgi:hypothetical protein